MYINVKKLEPKLSHYSILEYLTQKYFNFLMFGVNKKS